MTIYTAILTVGKQFAEARPYSSIEAADAAALVMKANARVAGYADEFGDYYLDEEDFITFIVTSILDESVIPVYIED